MFRLEQVSRSHDGRDVLRIDQLALGNEGVTVILGHNGSGKTTLMGLLARQDRPDTGRIALEGEPLAALRQRDLARRVAFLPQRLPTVHGLTVRELVRLGRFPWRGALGAWREEDHVAVENAIVRTGVTTLADRLVEETSGGERQRGWIAMLLAQDAPVLLLDEPTAALDLAHAFEVMALLRTLSREADRRVIVILHDINLATRFADRIVALKGGTIAFDGPPDALLSADVLRGLYGIDMTLLPRAGALPHAVVA
ncbi:ABC transporter ATP-binding protein [Halovulum dunhuangense]|uniref:ABC transporter ATP-binding protein n=1 Tax=Halovulum dunhuangense TaxID=1505036 RepID=A0A849L7N4_9RHOB|nr:ABC transporter ATP-binding protein [Halovulum dunhuangense]NNU82144.1 ABC transporter ATP-binding protein [Halovulum dunhuangense]